MSRASDLSKEEQANVRTALRFLHSRCGGWEALATAMCFNKDTFYRLSSRPITAAIAFRVARFAQVSIDDLLAGKYPAVGACPHCGHVKGEESPK